MTRDEIVELRQQVLTLVAELKRLDDYDTNARFIRTFGNALLRILDHMLSRMKVKP